jgi:hypothetical protein
MFKSAGVKMKWAKIGEATVEEDGWMHVIDTSNSTDEKISEFLNTINTFGLDAGCYDIFKRGNNVKVVRKGG